MSETSDHDYRGDWLDAAADPDRNATGSAGEEAAYRLALARGRCRLFGVEADLGAPLTVVEATAALRESVRWLTLELKTAKELGPRWDNCVDPVEAEELVAGLLEQRMDAWAVGLAINEVFYAEEFPLRELTDAIDAEQSAIDAFDTALEEHLDILSTLAGTRLLDNWRARLASEYRESLPWWLDGCLEEEARRIRREALATMPRAGGIRRKP